mgnify:CR=1 FL=1
MANETLITDLVAQEALDQLAALDKAMQDTLQTYTDVGKELAKGLKIPVEMQGDLDKLKQVYETQMQRAGQATQQLTNIQRQQAQVIANTTNTISRQLQEQEKLNKAQREAFTQNQRALDVADQVLGSREDNYRMMAKFTAEMKNLKDAMKRLDQEEKNGMVTTEQAVQRRASLMAEYDKVKAASQDLARILSVENKEANAASGSYQQLSQQLERLKQAQKQMNESEKASADGKALEAEIQNLDARLKDLAADMGEFQRNVGNYAIAGESMRSHLKELTETIARLTMEYEALDDSEKKEATGKALKVKIIELTEEAGKYKDIISDVKESIGNSAADTRLFDSLMESGQLIITTFGLANGMAQTLGLTEEELARSMAKVQAAMQAVQALEKIQLAFEKQSNIMKGIAILQYKAETAAINLKTAAEGKGIIATKAATAAQWLLNAAANANPYVLLAMALVTVVGALYAFTKGSEEASAQSEKAAEIEKRKTEAIKIGTDALATRKKVEEEMADSVASSVSKQLSNYTYLQKKWKECGDDINKQEKFLNDYKTELDNTGFAIKNVHDAHNVLVKQAPNVIKMYYALAEAAAAAAVAEEAFKRKIERQAKPNRDNGGYFVAAPGKYKDLSKDEKTLLSEGDYGIDFLGNPENLLPGGRKKINDYRKSQAQALRKALDDEDEAVIRTANMVREQAEKTVADLQNGIGTTFSNGGATGGNSKKTDKKGTSTSNSPKEEAVKDIDEIREEIDKLILDALKSQSSLLQEGTEEWAKLQREAIDQQKALDLAANEERRTNLIAELKKTKEAEKITEEQYQEELHNINEAALDKRHAIESAAKDKLKAIDEDVLAHKQELAEQELGLIERETEMEIASITASHADKMGVLRELYLQELREAEGNEQKITEIKKRYATEAAELTEQNAIEIAQASIKGLEEAIAMEDLSDEERERIAKELAKAKMDYAKAVANAEENELERTIDTEQEARDKRMDAIQDWAQKVGQAVSAVNDLFSAMYDNQISKIEDQIEAEQEQHDARIANIEELAERGAITTEEAELRKREAEAATAAKQEQLEKKKAQIEYKKAVMEKANTVAQIAIATALGIMQALAMRPPNIPLAAFVGAMGAIQTATALAQPIKAYKEGTKGRPHPGGLAVVGDGGTAELVMFGRSVWLTPDTPTLVDLPRGAEVFPSVTPEDVERLGASLPMAIPRDKTSGMPVIINDYTALEDRVAANTKAMGKYLSRLERSVTRELKNQRFAAYLSRRL